MVLPVRLCVLYGVSEMTYNVSSYALTVTHSLTLCSV